MRGKGIKLGEPCPKVRLSQDRLPILQLCTNVIRANVASSKCHSTNFANSRNEEMNEIVTETERKF